MINSTPNTSAEGSSIADGKDATMNEDLSEFLSKLYEFGTDHDSKIKVHSEQLLNITPDTGLFLSILIQAVRARRVLEIGTSNGYSTIWIADALSNLEGGIVTTVEVSEKKFGMARVNFAKSGLSRNIDSHLADIRSFLKETKDESVDLLFLDAERPQYVSYWIDLDRVLKTNGLLLVDNALSPKPEELVDFFKIIKDSHRYLSQTLQIGKGQMIALKQHGRERE
jgi:predicted O-methyltransferase YrrM